MNDASTVRLEAIDTTETHILSRCALRSLDIAKTRVSRTTHEEANDMITIPVDSVSFVTVVHIERAAKRIACE